MQKATNRSIDERLNPITDCLYRVAAKAIIIRDHKILLVKEKPGWFGLTGGGIDHGQTPQEALIREVTEEVGASIDVSQIEPQPSFITVDGRPREDKIPRTSLYYKVIVDHGFSPKTSELSYMWVSKDELDQILLGPTITLIKDGLIKLI